MKHLIGVHWIEPPALPQLPENPLRTAYRIWEEQTAALMRGERVEMKLEGEILKELPLEPYDPAVCLRREFSLRRGIAGAELAISAHGIYEARINGRDVTDTLLNPGFTDYDRRILYQVYDVTPLLAEENAIAVTVADGWYKGKLAIGRGCEYGEVPGLIARLAVTYEDGTGETVETGGDWTASYDGPVREADLFKGEVYEAGRETGDPSLPGFDESGWQPVLVREEADDTLEEQSYPPVRVIAEIPAREILTAPNGDTIVDFGQNMAGMLRVLAEGEPGQEISFEHGETLDREGNFTYVFEKTNLCQRDVYIPAKEGVHVFSPRFTYHGFRYVRVRGGKNWTRERFTALAISTDNRMTGSFVTDHEGLNRLQQNILWSQRANNIGIPTDCPTREKAGWTGDVVVYAPTALFLQDMKDFYCSWLREVRLGQREDGQILGTVPQMRSYVSQAASGSLGWGDVILTLPYTLYRTYGELEILRENHEAMGKWFRAMQSAAFALPDPALSFGGPAADVTGLSGRRLDNMHYLINSGFHFGDWIIPSVVNEQGFTDGPASAFLTMNYCDTAILAHTADLYAEISDLLGEAEKAEEARAYAERVREAFREEYVTKENRLGQEMQGNYILALAYHMVEGETAKAFAARLNEMIRENGYRLDTGFMSTPHLLDVLAGHGYEETAFRVLFQTECPSWLYEVEHGATTMWENWDAIRPDGQINGCSFNHYAFGCVGDFLYRRILGIQCAAPGYERITISPLYGVPLGMAKGHYDSVRGRISLCWEKQGGRVMLSGEIPDGVLADLHLPDGTRRELGAGRFAVSADLPARGAES